MSGPLGLQCDVDKTPEQLNQAAARFVADRHWLGAFVGGLVRDPHAAEDIIQEVWVRLASAIDKGNAPENQSAWCRGTAKNLVLNHWRSKRDSKTITDSRTDESFLDRVDLAFTESETDRGRIEERLAALRTCVDSLPQKARTVLTLRYLQKQSPSEVAVALDLSEDAVIKQLYRLRRALHLCVKAKLS